MLNLTLNTSTESMFTDCFSSECGKLYSDVCNTMSIQNSYWFMLFFAVSFLFKCVLSIIVWRNIKLDARMYRFIRGGINIFETIGWVCFAIQILS